MYFLLVIFIMKIETIIVKESICNIVLNVKTKQSFIRKLVIGKKTISSALIPVLMINIFSIIISIKKNKNEIAMNDVFILQILLIFFLLNNQLITRGKQKRIH